MNIKYKKRTPTLEAIQFLPENVSIITTWCKYFVFLEDRKMGRMAIPCGDVWEFPFGYWVTKQGRGYFNVYGSEDFEKKFEQVE